MINKIYLHWTAGRYDQLFNDYHICIDGDGGVHRMADFNKKLAHTWLRNTDAVGIALCCCYGAGITSLTYKKQNLTALRSPFTKGAKNSEVLAPFRKGGDEVGGFEIHWGLFPPTEIQIVSMAQCVAEICREYNLPIRYDTVMTHAEVADIDGYGVYDNDPDMRWDLFRLPGVEGSGGDYIRRVAGQFREQITDNRDQRTDKVGWAGIIKNSELRIKNCGKEVKKYGA